MKRSLILGAPALALLASPALGQTTAAADPGPIATILLPVALALAGLAVPVLGAMIWSRVSPALDAVQRLTGVQIDAEHRAALHGAIDTGLKLAFAEGAPALANTLAAHVAAGRIGEVSGWVERSVPGAIAHLGVTRSLLDGLITAHLGNALAPVEAAAAPVAEVATGAAAALADVAAGAGAAIGLPAMLPGAAILTGR